MQREEVFSILVQMISESFDFEPEKLSLTTHLYEDLDLDSLDAIELAVQLQDVAGKRVLQESLREVRTIEDVVEMVMTLQSQQ